MKYKSLYKLYFTPDSGKKIYNERFNNENTYHFNFKINESEAFLCLNMELSNKIDKINELNNEVYSFLIKNLSNYNEIYNWLFNHSLVEEIVLTNAIEGVVSTRKEINALIDKSHPKKYLRFYGLVNKYKKILDNYSFIAIKNSKDLRNIYDQILLQDIENSDKKNIPDGKIFRKDPVSIISSTKTIHQGSYPEEKIIDNIDEALNILNNEELPFLIRVAIFHYLMGYIHPFYDGNGRISRYISSYYLARNLNPFIALRLSVSCKRQQKKYYDGFKYTNDIRNKGDLTFFVLNFFEIFIDGIEELLSDLNDIYNQYNFYKNVISSITNINDIQYEILHTALLARLFKIDCDYDLLVEHTKKTRKTVNKYLNPLIEEQYLQEGKSGNHKYFLFNEEFFSQLVESQILYEVPK